MSVRRDDALQKIWVSEGRPERNVTRDMAIWLFGLLACGILGGILGNHHGFDGKVWGFIWGAFVFLCVRLWLAWKNHKT